MAAPGVIRGDGTYLITGGLGGLGLTTARWLVRRGAAFWSWWAAAPSAAAQATIAELRAGGATVYVRQADCSSARTYSSCWRDSSRLRAPAGHLSPGGSAG